MSFMKHSSARHRVETTSHVVRNTAVAAAAAGVALAVMAPAQAAGDLVDFGGADTRASVPSLQDLTATTYQGAAAHSSGVSTQSNSSASGVVATAYQGIGGAYVWGGTSFKAWDCSGFTQWVFAQHGINLPRVTWSQIAAATPTATPQPGDLVSQNGGNHVGVYIGNGQMISALNPQQGTMVHSVNAMALDGYYTFR